MRRTFIVEIDNEDSEPLRKQPQKTLKAIFRTIADQVYWNDTSRDVRDRNGTVIGRWRLVENVAEAVR